MNAIRETSLKPESTPEQAAGLADIGLDDFAPYLMNRIMGRYNADLREQLAKMGLTTPKMRTLSVLSVRNGLHIGELAVYAVVDHSTLSRALDQLMTDGLVQRIRDEHDSRATHIFITGSGRAEFERLWPFMARAYEKMFLGITHSERNALIKTLHKMLENVRQHEI